METIAGVGSTLLVYGLTMQVLEDIVSYRSVTDGVRLMVTVLTEISFPAVRPIISTIEFIKERSGIPVTPVIEQIPERQIPERTEVEPEREQEFPELIRVEQHL